MTEIENVSSGIGLSWNSRDLLECPRLLFRRPTALFARLAKTGSVWPAVLFSLVWLFVSTVVELVVSRFRPVPVPVPTTVQVGWLVIGPLLLLGLGWVLSVILYAVWFLMGSREDLKTAFRCWAYMTPISTLGAVLSVVPYLNILTFFYGLALLAIASTATHRIPTRKAWSVWGFIGLAMIVWTVMSMRKMPAPKPASLVPTTEAGSGPLAEVAKEISAQIETAKETKR